VGCKHFFVHRFEGRSHLLLVVFYLRGLYWHEEIPSVLPTLQGFTSGHGLYNDCELLLRLLLEDKMVTDNETGTAVLSDSCLGDSQFGFTHMSNPDSLSDLCEI
jgi:hypothetical protein